MHFIGFCFDRWLKDLFSHTFLDLFSRLFLHWAEIEWDGVLPLNLYIDFV
jgi:hypothetical protein